MRSEMSAKKVIGRYRLGERIGAGGMGTVFKAQHIDLGREVALKILPEELTAREDMLERFRQEAKHAAKLRHDHIVTLYEFGESNGVYYLAMEYVQGRNLHEYIHAKGKLEPEEARKLIIQAAKALSLAHKQGIVHRDIKPSNFLLTRKDGKPFVKLTDFGLARSSDEEEFNLTRTGTTVGTVDYISPEQARNSRSADIRSDIYSLGCTLFHMVAGQAPFPDGDLTARLLKHVEAEPPDPRAFNPKIPGGMVLVLNRMLAKSPADRYQTPDDLLDDLEKVAKSAVVDAKGAIETLAAAEKTRPMRTPNLDKKPPTTPVPKPPVAPTNTEMAALHYRHLKKRTRKKHLEKERGDSGFVIEGIGAWLVVAAVVGGGALLAYVLFTQSGNKKPVEFTDLPDEQIAQVQPETKGTQSTKRDDRPAIPRQTDNTPGEGGKGDDAPGKPAIELPDQSVKPAVEEKKSIYTPNKETMAQLQKEFNVLRTSDPVKAFDDATPQGSQSVGPVQGQNAREMVEKLTQDLRRQAQEVVPDQNPYNPPNPADFPRTNREAIKKIEQLHQEVEKAQPGAPTKQTPQPGPGNSPQSPQLAGQQQPKAVVPPSGGLPKPPIGGSKPSSGGGNSATAPGTPRSTDAQPSTNPPKTPNANLPNSTQPPDLGKPAQPAEAGKPAETNTERRPAVQILTRFDSVARAASAIPLGGTGILEIRDDGPIYSQPILIAGRNVVIRAGAGYRPLLIWDVLTGSSARLGAFISSMGGSLTLENIDIAMKCSETGRTEYSAVCFVKGGNFAAEGCTFSVAGRQKTPISVVHVEGAENDNLGQIRLSRCYLRGSEIAAISSLGSAGEIYVDRSLIVGGNHPLIDLGGRAQGEATQVRVARSTLVAAQSLARIRPMSADDHQPAVNWLLWDTLLSRYGASGAGDLLDLEDGVGPEHIHWNAINSLYSGWETLLKSDGQIISQADMMIWRSLWKYTEGDRAGKQTWPRSLPPDLAEASADAFRVTGSQVDAGATSGQGSIGCDPASLPPIRPNWGQLAFGRLTPPPADLPSVDQPPEIPTRADGLYAGDRLDLTKVDLADHLRKIESKQGFGPRVVLHLAGTGEVPLAPIHLKRTTLVLYFEKPKGDSERLTLVAKGEGEAFIEIEDGGLEIIGGSFAYPREGDAPMPASMFKIQGGDLRLSGCRLMGALANPGKSYRNLIQIQGTGPGAEGFRDCAIADSTLVSARNCVTSTSSGVRVRMQNCVVVSGTEAFRIEPDSLPKQRLNCQYFLDRNTIAARGTVFHLIDVPSLSGPVEPIFVRAQNNVFLDPFAGSKRESGLLTFDEAALTRGLLVWQGDGNAYDKQLHHYLWPHGVALTRNPQPYGAWVNFCGPLGDRKPIFLASTQPRTFDWDKLSFDALTLPQAVRVKMSVPPGADFDQLGILNKSPGQRR
jgi:serine/threonine protein kinase